MIVTKHSGRSKAFLSGLSNFLETLPKFKVKLIPVKYHAKPIFIIVLSTIFLWTWFLAYIIYRNTPKEMVTELANVVGIKATQKKKKSLESLKAVTLAPFNWASAKFFGEEIPRIHIDIKFKDFQKIEKIRYRALADHQLTQGPDDYVPAKIRHGNRIVKVKLRLKGDGIDHLVGDKWSFRIHVKGKDHLFKMRRFSIQKPETRNYETEILFFEALRREGILAPRYFFIEVTINGKDIGLMAVEEHFSKELLEAQGRKESVILKFNEFLLHEELNGANGFFPGLANYRNVDVQPFRSNHVANSDTLTSHLKMARGLLRSFISRSLPASQVFDPELMGRFIAVADLWGGWHTLAWHNIRLYYNPITNQLEPIGFDATLKERRAPFPAGYRLAMDILSDEKILEIYRKTFSRLVDEINDGSLAAWAFPLQKSQLRILHREYPYLTGMNLEQFIQRAQYRGREIEASFRKYLVILNAYSINNPGKPSLELVNPLPQSVVITSINLVDPDSNSRLEFPAHPRLEYPIQLRPTLAGELPRSNVFYYRKPDEKKNYSIEITAHLLNDDTPRLIKAIPYHPPLQKYSLPEMSIRNLLQAHPFLAQNGDSRHLHVKPGTWKVNGWIAIPKGVALRIPKGTELRFAPSAGLIARGPVFIDGTKNRPVILSGTGAPHPNDGWQGIVVMKTSQPSIWSHTIVRDTRGIHHNGWSLTGGVNFYEADIKMKNVSLIGNRCEDALNIVRSNFELDSVSIKNAASDGFDADFSKGTVQEGVFENIGRIGGGDGIDVSGTEITVTGTKFQNILDKALSVGEKSTMIATDLSMEQVGTAAVSKDSSHLTLSNVAINQAVYAGLMAYVKKPEYGPGAIVASHIETRAVPTLAVAQKGSRVTIDGADIKEVDLDVKELYATLMKPGMKK